MTFTYTYPDLQQRIDRIRSFERFCEMQLRRSRRAGRLEELTGADARVLQNATHAFGSGT